ncbi:hypothetical protein TNCV_1349371 [Trichonephila clavipes]|nr:hypothetical protein TNCV_1349371 [Trichonephila clavipes]
MRGRLPGHDGRCRVGYVQWTTSPPVLRVEQSTLTSHPVRNVRLKGHTGKYVDGLQEWEYISVTPFKHSQRPFGSIFAQSVLSGALLYGRNMLTKFIVCRSSIYGDVMIQFLRARHHSKPRHRWVGVKGRTHNGRRDPKCPTARRFRLVREDTDVSNERCCACMEADEARVAVRVHFLRCGGLLHDWSV